MGDEWQWQDFCGTNSSDIRVWIGEDFGHCFEQLALACPSHTVLATVSAYYMALFARTRLFLHDHVPKPLVVTLRFLLCLILMLAPSIRIVVYYLVENGFPAPVDLVTDGVTTFAWFLHSISTWRLRHAYVFHVPLRGPVCVVFAFFLVLASNIIQVQTIARLSVTTDSTHSNSWESYYTYCGTGVHVIYLLTLLKSKKPISQPYLRISAPGETDRLLASSYAGYGATAPGELNVTYSNVNIVSKLLFTWVRPLLQRGARDSIRLASDLFTVPKSLSTSHIREMALNILYKRPEPTRNVYVTYDDVSSKSLDTYADSDDETDTSAQHEARPMKTVTTRTLFQTLNKAFGWHYYPIGILKIVADLAAFVSPIMLNYLVLYIENKNETESNGYIYASGLLAATLVQAFTNSQFSYHVNVVGLKVRAALVTVVYHKTLSASSVSMGAFSSGEIVNFMSTDTDRIVNFCPTFHQLWSLPLQVCLSLYLLYNQVGLAFLAGLGFAVLVIPVNRWIAVKIGTLSERMMSQKDARVQVVNEVLRGIRVVKYYTLEEYFKEKISRLRHLELASLKGRKYLDALCVYFWASTPVLISILTFGTYALLGHEVTASKVFTSLAVFNILTMPLNAFPWVINGFMEARVSLRRLETFLKLDDLDWLRYYNREAFRARFDDTILYIDGATFSWQYARNSRESETGTVDLADDRVRVTSDQLPVSERKSFHLRSISLEVKKGQFVGVIGCVGSGKSSVLAAILAEMRKVQGTIEVVGLETGFGYCSQESWVQHGTLRENVLCGSVYNMARYAAVIEACALNDDIESMPAGDMTEVGENGVTLSGGQKARISLARAVYQDKDVYLLDDPFSAVDAHVAAHIYARCIMGLLKHKTRIVCTHHVQWLRVADWLVVMDDGRITQSGPPDRVLGQCDRSAQKDAPANEKSQLAAVEELTTPSDDLTYESRLVEDEEQATGAVNYSVYKAYWRAVGTCLGASVLVSVILMQASRNANDWWLSYWVTHSHANQTTDTPIFTPHYANDNHAILLKRAALPWTNLTSGADNVNYYLTVYGSLAACNSLLTFIRAFVFAYGGVCAARALHNSLLSKILKAPVYFFDSTPLGRVINRFSSDVYAIDDTLPFMLNILLAQGFGLIGVLVVTCYGLPWVLVLLVPLGFIYYMIQKYYRMTSREVKRIMSVTLSPVYAHFAETVSGLTTIRAFRITDKFSRQNEWKYEQYQRAQYSAVAAGAWFDICLQMIGVAMVTGVAFIAVLEHHFRYVNSGLVGLAISYALGITGLLNGVVVYFTETEKQMVSVERAVQYINDVPTERQDSLIEAAPFWPLQGGVVFDRVILQYRHAMTNALDVVSFDVRPGEKVGIVGRTGSGKSSLLQVLYRMVEIQSGSITIDAINIAHVALKQLRSRLAIIPQDPYLFSGTIRENLDPTSAYPDSALWNVLGKCHVTMAVDRLGGLDAQVAEGGKHFSVGQRQLICLARALLSKAKILCLDEATASIDRQTDDVIQETIRSEFGDLTVLTIAHRISTVMDCDRVLVMSGGRVAEYAPPHTLLKKANSIFAGLAQEGHL